VIVVTKFYFLGPGLPQNRCIASARAEKEAEVNDKLGLTRSLFLAIRALLLAPPYDHSRRRAEASECALSGREMTEPLSGTLQRGRGISDWKELAYVLT
jgi:hypothetical protein